MEIPRVVAVQDQASQEWCEVDTRAWKCSCRSRSRGCSHVSRARDVHLNKCEQSRWEFVSAMHKEIRRGDVAAALYWADLLARVSHSYVEFYAKQIAGEETRNIHFMRETFRNDPEWTYRDWVAAVAGSRKKWEGANQCDLFREQVRGSAAFAADGSENDERTARQILEDGLATRSAAEVFLALNWFYFDEDASAKTGGAIWSDFDEIMALEASRKIDGVDFSELARRYVQVTRRDAFEIRVMMIEAAFGAWDETMNDYPHAPGVCCRPSDGARLRSVPEYAYDVHVHAGKRRVAELFPSLAPGAPSPGKLDLRWSGQMIGLAWRYAAYDQLGADYAAQPWEAVRWDDEYWKLSLAYNAE